MTDRTLGRLPFRMLDDISFFGVVMGNFTLTSDVVVNKVRAFPGVLVLGGNCGCGNRKLVQISGSDLTHSMGGRLGLSLSEFGRLRTGTPRPRVATNIISNHSL